MFTNRKKTVGLPKKVTEVYDNEWIKPKRKSFLAVCCDCNLVHEMDFKPVRKGRCVHIFIRARRRDDLTKIIRKRNGVTVRG